MLSFQFSVPTDGIFDSAKIERANFIIVIKENHQHHLI